MNVLYLDSSVIVSLLLEEETAHFYRTKLQKAKELISASLLEAEIYSVATREQIELKNARLFIEPVTLVTPDRSLASEYNLIFSKGYCRGADAFHLACALYLDPSREELIFLTQDNRQKKIASQLGFRLA